MTFEPTIPKSVLQEIGREIDDVLTTSDVSRRLDEGARLRDIARMFLIDPDQMVAYVEHRRSRLQPFTTASGDGQSVHP